jgi:signal transduction histidine kinase/CheY-like chemotaxis protein
MRVSDSAYLSVLTGPRAGSSHKLGQGAVIGRGSEAQIALVEEAVSRNHASVRRLEGGDYLLEDLGSKNGTQVNGMPVTSHRLQAGDRILLAGETLLLFSRRSQDEDYLLEMRKLESLARLAGGIAHDFNNLLQVITGNLHLLAMQTGGQALRDPDLAQGVEDAVSAVNDARDLVQQLLGFARYGEWQECPVNLAGLFGEVALLLSHTVDPSITLSVDAEPGLRVMGDRSKLFQVLVNLCLNARDSMPQGGELVLSAKLEEAPESPVLQGCGQVAHIRVRDSGVGMDEDTRRRVFEPFFSTKRLLSRGAGLGLAVVHGVVTGHGGEVWVESEPRKGSTFHVMIPALLMGDDAGRDGLEKEPRHLLTSDSEPERRPASSGRLVLVVDDDALVRRGLGRLLKAIGYEVELASGGAEALVLYPKIAGRLAFVLLDLVMPDMDGRETLLGLLDLDHEARVLVMSGHYDEVTVNDLTSCGARAYIRKPFELEELQAAIHKVL